MREEQSTVAKGTSRIEARVWRMYVLPTPEGPRRRRLDFSIMIDEVVWVERIVVLPRSEDSDGGGEGDERALRSTVSTWPGNSSTIYQ